MADAAFAVPVPPQERREVPPEAVLGATELLLAADADADALADRLHDGALQALVVARYAADAAVRGGDPVLARDAVQAALTALRHSVWLLRPRGEDDLVGALTELATRTADADGPSLDLELDPAAAAGLAPVARATAYRFVQAATVDGGAVHLRRRGRSAVLTVEGGAVDDAAGWTARALALGGRLDSPAAPARLLLPLTTLLDDDNEGDR